MKEPKNFNDILELQDILDNNINNIRERTIRDIELSLIAEIIEFNEETQYSHKTWKTKEYSKEKELEELTDIYFFFAQMINYKLEHVEDYNDCKNIVVDILSNKPLFNKNDKCNRYLDYLILCGIEGAEVPFSKELIKITYYYGYTKDDILKCYWKKWQKNMHRIGKEWN